MSELKNAKIAVINFSGNVGKSTVSKHLLQPRMDGATLLAVETINADEGADLTVTGQQFGAVQTALLTADGAVLDIGASNVEAVMAMMAKYKGSHEDFDLFVVPVTKDAKQMLDTMRIPVIVGTHSTRWWAPIPRDRGRRIRPTSAWSQALV